MGRRQQITALVVALAVGCAGCFGSFNLTRKLYNWNDSVSKDKWIKEAVFLVLIWAPIYGLAGLGDAVIFNTIEFWSGENPIDMKTTSLSQSKRIVRGDAEVRLRVQGHELWIEQVVRGESAGSLRIVQQGERSVAIDQEGRVLLTAQTLPDGTVLITDAMGTQTAIRDADLAG